MLQYESVANVVLLESIESSVNVLLIQVEHLNSWLDGVSSAEFQHLVVFESMNSKVKALSRDRNSPSSDKATTDFVLSSEEREVAVGFELAEVDTEWNDNTAWL